MYILLCFSLVSAVTSLNETALFRACRPEDGYHRCLLNGDCVRRWQVGSEACENASVICGNDEFPCRVTSRCIPRNFVGTKNGCDIDDEDVRLPCRPGEHKCQESGVCIERHAVGDGMYNCISGSINDTTDEEVSYKKCHEGEFLCSGDSRGKCIPREWVMDGSNDCKDGTDEKSPLETCMDNEFRCENGRCVPRYRINDGFPDCEDGLDETKPFSECYNDTEFRCTDSGRCIPRSWVMDGIQNCPNKSDENVASNFACVEGEFRCKNERRCLPLKYTCDGVNHCGDCSDEVEACDEPRMWRCPGNSSICIPQAYGCDGFPDCPGSKDNPVYLPGFKCPKTVVGTEIARCAIPQWTLNDNHSYCDDRSDICFKNGNFKCARCVSSTNIISEGQICDDVIDRSDMTDECLCNSNIEIEQLCQAICYAGIPSVACEFCNKSELFCPDDNICVSLSDVCNGKNDCQTSSLDEKFCAGTSIKPNSWNSTSCSPVLYNTDPFSSDTEMIKSVPGLILLWLIGIVGTIVNILGIYKDYHCWKGYSEKKRQNRPFRINIFMSHAGMSITTLALVAKSITFSGHYCSEDRAWRVSGQCATFGVLFFAFNQVSIFTLLCTACFRLNARFRGFKHYLLSVKSRVIPSIFTWIVSFLLSTFPLIIPNQSALISPFLYFNDTILNFHDFQKFAKRIFTLSPSSPPQNDFKSWTNIQSNLESSYSEFSPIFQGYFGYYSPYGICIPRMIDQSQKSHLFTFTIIALNFFILIFNAVAAWSTLYAMATTKIGESDRSVVSKPAGRRQITSSVVSAVYLCCWFPISLMAFLGKADVTVPDSAYAVGVLLLPLPSALCPFIYSFGYRKKFNVILERLRSRKRTKSERTSQSTAHETNL